MHNDRFQVFYLHVHQKDVYKRQLLLKVNQKEMPKIYMACGKDDRLLQVNRDFRDYLKNHQVDVLYEEGEGKHEWDFWDRYIYRVLEWLPLNEDVYKRQTKKDTEIN